ncbi:hypothetical protein [Streptomyces sp. NRRL S-237]|uniref:hypothetical protein n=1 Tax=Streptomyces sp. NRRL S-237 TaxID=1463895 RepID=UPI00068B8C7F|nr:hypothetical protein [Streptomyces sp. NRRL S-237]
MERLALGDGLGDGGAEVRDALGDGDGDADFEALGDGEAERDGLPLVGDGLAEGAAGAALVAGAEAFASTSVVSLSVELGSAHTATAVPLRATAAAAPISSASGFREAEPVRFSGPPPPPPPPPASLPYVWPAAGIARSWTVSARLRAYAGPAGSAGHGPSCGGTGIPYAGVSSCAGAGAGAGTGAGCGSGATTPDTGCGDTGVSGSAGSGNVTYGRMRKGLKPTPGTHPQPAPAAPHSGQC